MEALIEELSDVIRQELWEYEQLLASLEQEQDMLVHHETDKLQEVTSGQHRLVEQAKTLERARLRVVERLSDLLGEDPSDLTLKRLIVRVGGAQGEQLRQMRDALVGAHERIRKANRNNALLIRQSMKYVDRTLHILSGDDLPAGVYAGSGKLETRTSGGQAVVDQVA